MVFQNDIIAGASGAGGGYTIDQSIRFNDGDSPYLNRTFGTPTSNSQFGYSFWIKLGEGYNGKYIISANGGGNNDNFYFSSNKITIQEGGVNRLVSNQLFRDYSSWYHFVVAYDLGNATASQKLRVYLNGSEITSWATDTRSSLSSTSSRLNAAVSHDVGANVFNGVSSHINNWDGYIAEFHFVDGTVLTPTDFGEYNSDGVWIPIEASPTYGNNGFYITGADSADLGADDSGNSNDFTSSGLATTDQMLDTPTDNFCTWNPLRKGPAHTLSDGNLLITSTLADATFGTFMVNSGKWYWEITALSAECIFGIGDEIAPPAAAFDTASAINTRGYNGFNGQKTNNGSGSAYGATYTTNDVIGIALNMDDGEITFYKNNVSQGVAFTGLTGFWGPGASVGNTRSCRANFGQSAFTYTPPTGFNALSTANLPDPTIADPSAHFQTTVYTGNGTAIGSGGLEVNQSGNSTFQPDFAWIKNRTTGGNEHDLYDAVRGATKVIFSSTVGAEATVTEGLVSFDSDGFTVGNRGEVNTSGNSMAAWQWKANGSGSSNTDGSITSTVSADTTSGFSIATYTGNGTSGATFGHGLGVAPKMVIVKERSPGGNNWMVGHDSVGWTKYLALDAAQAAITSSARWNNTAPSSTVVTLGNDTGINASGATYLAYCFAEVEGFSKISSFEGNSNADGPFVYTGFKPAFILTKNMDTADQWGIRDAVRNPYNVTDKLLNPNAATAETTSSTGYIDILSNGFKPRSSDSNINTQTIIYMAFAESPFKTATAR